MSFNTVLHSSWHNEWSTQGSNCFYYTNGTMVDFIRLRFLREVPILFREEVNSALCTRAQIRYDKN